MAVAAASDAQKEWQATPAPERGAILRRAAAQLDDRKETVTKSLTQVEGKTIPEASGEVARAVDILYYYAEKARDLGGEVKSASSRDARIETMTTPVGVTGLITPWNYPIAIPAWKLAPALATGNTVVLKPASQAPTPAFNLAECLDEVGLPDGVLNVVTGPGSEVGEMLCSHEDVDAVSFTGSTFVGEHVGETAAASGKRVQLEMGGKNPTVVASSANASEAAGIVADGAFGVTGQACTATSRAIVHEDVYESFVEELVARAENLNVGSGLDGSDVGPQVTADELESTLEYVNIGQSEGATLETGGEALNHDDGGHFIRPTVFSNVTTNMRIAQEEIFGPVVGVISVNSFEEGLEVANDSRYGLAASVVTNDLAEANRFATEVEAGVVKINEKTTGLELHVPFGGMKDSSSGTWREQGDAGLDFYTSTRTIYQNY